MAEGEGEETTDDDNNDDNDDDNNGNDEDKDHNNNTTIKQCMGERGADDDGGDRQLTVGNIDNDRRNRDRP